MSKYKEVMQHVVLTDEMEQRILGNIEKKIAGGLDKGANIIEDADCFGQMIEVGEDVDCFEEKSKVNIIAGGKDVKKTNVKNKSAKRRKTWTMMTAAAAVLIMVSVANFGHFGGVTPDVHVQDASGTVVTENKGLNAMGKDATGKDVESKGANAGNPVTFEVKKFETLEGLCAESGVEMTELENLPFEPVRIEYTLYGEYPTISYYDENDVELFTRVYSEDGDESGLFWDFDFEREIDVDGVEVVIKGVEDQVLVAYWRDGQCTRSIAYESGMSEEEVRTMVK